MKEAEKVLTPMFTVFFVLGMAMRHELSYQKVVDWIILASCTLAIFDSTPKNCQRWNCN
jgi:hypothetical protein